MPYIKDKNRREALQNGDIARCAGELNFQCFYFIKHQINFTKEGMNQLKTFVDNFLGIKPNYQKYNDMTGALIRCSKEVKRRFTARVKCEYANFLEIIMNSYDSEIAKYEDLKINENGDVE